MAGPVGRGGRRCPVRSVLFRKGPRRKSPESKSSLNKAPRQLQSRQETPLTTPTGERVGSVPGTIEHLLHDDRLFTDFSSEPPCPACLLSGAPTTIFPLVKTKVSEVTKTSIAASVGVDSREAGRPAGKTLACGREIDSGGRGHSVSGTQHPVGLWDNHFLSGQNSISHES